MNSGKRLIPTLIALHGARGGTRTPTLERTTDFKSVASTIPPHGQGHYCDSTSF